MISLFLRRPSAAAAVRRRTLVLAQKQPAPVAQRLRRIGIKQPALTQAWSLLKGEGAGGQVQEGKGKGSKGKGKKAGGAAAPAAPPAPPPSRQEVDDAWAACRAVLLPFSPVEARVAFAPGHPSTAELENVFHRLCRARRWRAAEECFDALMAHGQPSRVKVTTFTLMVKLQCRKAGFFAPRQKRDPRKVLEGARRVVETMVDVGVRPNNFTVSTLVSAYGRAGLWQEALDVFEWCRGPLGVAPNIFVYNAALDALKRGSQVDALLELFRSMQHEAKEDAKEEAKEVVSAAAARAAGKAKKGKASDKDESITPDAYSYQTAISACAGAGRLPDAQSLFDDMVSRGVAPDVLVFNALLDACAKAGEPDCGLQVFQHMRTMKDAASAAAPGNNASKRRPPPGKLWPDNYSLNAMLESLCASEEHFAEGRAFLDAWRRWAAEEAPALVPDARKAEDKSESSPITSSSTSSSVASSAAASSSSSSPPAAAAITTATASSASSSAATAFTAASSHVDGWFESLRLGKWAAQAEATSVVFWNDAPDSVRRKAAPNVISYNILLDALGKRRLVDEVDAVARQMHQIDGIEPDDRTRTILIGAFEGSPLAAEWFDEDQSRTAVVAGGESLHSLRAREAATARGGTYHEATSAGRRRSGTASGVVGAAATAKSATGSGGAQIGDRGPVVIDLHGMRKAEACVAVLKALEDLADGEEGEAAADGSIQARAAWEEELHPLEGRRELVVITGVGDGLVLREEVVRVLRMRSVEPEVAPEGNRGRVRVTARAIADYSERRRRSSSQQAVVRRTIYRGTALYAVLFTSVYFAQPSFLSTISGAVGF